MKIIITIESVQNKDYDIRCRVDYGNRYGVFLTHSESIESMLKKCAQWISSVDNKKDEN